ncbi:hypothetical protein AUQ37_01230 [Candidatus Methanomethylophilus sp. 1R26]|jgi:predicted RNA-binding protein|uniref:CooT family nickel-binding protein n=1 Tax=Candidatus Methanomethylophilus sp. 1R26 TaxID=1769296 RepID=UPI000736E354|nr:CooT family nickel-binding protein [Candidatus Methanomethylophilus sp. 1R26]MCH3978604.1 CooT family nickel-binding protein [Methanomethylophilus sp.]TQS78901.1 MAG: hypothetical protein A3Q59_00900 [Methanomethylophilus alvi]WII09475.1 CooT family nickel-binding protein [Methanomassiliicoccales archaeon LGM-DZ1]KUE73571.1 hypothetical protein AUQ37_01230 [Candidatus Methanomethylophilus sp. 1R26]MCI2074278.1 CooT family nickel-binding protein [Methanomethylophilus sp.]
MCEFTVYLDGHDDENVVAEKVIKVTSKPDHITLMDTSGKTYKFPSAEITKVDTIMTELWLQTRA